MPNESVLATLNEMLLRYAANRASILGRIQDCRELVFDATANLKRAEEADRRAIYDDDQLVLKMRGLTAYYNSLPEGQRPQAILEQQAQMGREQLETHRRRMAAHEVVREQMRLLEEAKRDLAVAEQNETSISQRIRETTAEIDRLNGR